MPEKTLEQSEAIKYLFDHIKSIWTLSAGGLAFSVGILGFVSKELLTTPYVYHLCQLVITISLVLYTASILTGLDAHRKLISAMLNSEIAPEGPEKKDKKEIIEAIYKAYDRFILSRTAFIGGGAILVMTTLFFIAWSSFVPNKKSADVSITIKSATILTNDSRRIEVQDMTFKLPGPDLWITSGRTIEVKDLTFKAEFVDRKP
jgi:hypothetical protein